uniref:Uncharacterized protein n=1 Tax=Oryza meridionalis TaxID=40149 RepID=A0A0E0CV32_9ORYZ
MVRFLLLSSPNECSGAASLRLAEPPGVGCLIRSSLALRCQAPCVDHARGARGGHAARQPRARAVSMCAGWVGDGDGSREEAKGKTGASDRTAAQHGPAPSYRSLWISTVLVCAIIVDLFRLQQQQRSVAELQHWSVGGGDLRIRNK